MKILHICLAGLYMDGWEYQENMMAKYQILDGHDVTVITGKWVIDEEGRYIKSGQDEEIDGYGVKIVRISIKGDKPYSYKLKRYVGVYENIERIAPNIIFLHCPQILDVDAIVQYKKRHLDVKIYADNHCDYSNSATNWVSKYILHGIVWRHSIQKLDPYTEKFYGVMPARVDFLIERYKLKQNRVELLVMGADDESVARAGQPEIKTRVREQFHIRPEDFLIVTGGKIDAFKTQTLLLMEAVGQIERDNLKLLIFGSVEEALKEKFDSLCDGEKIRYIGWAKGEQSYEYFASADLIVFPGRHSVYWEQVVAQGIPMICKYWDGTTHVDIGGNVEFLMNDSVETIRSKLLEILETPGKYKKMKEAANSERRREFSYQQISRRAAGIEEQ